MGKRVPLPKARPSNPKTPRKFYFESPEPTNTPVETKENVPKEERIYDESEVCYSKVHTTHETNDHFGKVVIWENAPEVKRALFAPYVENIQVPGQVINGKRIPLAKFTMVGGHRNGRFRAFYPNGQVKFETKYNMSRETGPRKFWNEAGEPVTHPPTNS